MGIVVVPRGTTFEAALAAIAKGEPVPVPVLAGKVPQPGSGRIATHIAARNPTDTASRNPVDKRDRALLRDQLKHGPRPAAQVEAAARAADIPKHALLDATDALGVRARRGRWWIPGQKQDSKNLSLWSDTRNMRMYKPAAGNMHATLVEPHWLDFPTWRYAPSMAAMTGLLFAL
jgi:hypothetical protein